MKSTRRLRLPRLVLAGAVALLAISNFISPPAAAADPLTASNPPAPAWTPAQPGIRNSAAETLARSNSIQLPPPAPLANLADELAEARRQLAESRLIITNLNEKTDALQAKLRTLARNARFVLEGLRTENETLQKELFNRKASPAPAPPAADALALEQLQGQLAKLRARLNVLEATPVPFTPEELALFRHTETLAANHPAPPGTNAPAPVAENTIALLREAQSLFAQHDYERARAKYLEVLAAEPRNPATLANLAIIELELNQPAAAEEHLQSALAIAPNDAFSLGVLGNLRFREGKYDLALDALSRAAELNPKDPEIQNYLGVTLSQKGQRAAAEAALRRAIQLDPEYGGAHNNLAVIYLTQTPPQVELARWHYQKALAAGQAHNPELESLIEKSARPAELAQP